MLVGNCIVFMLPALWVFISPEGINARSIHQRAIKTRRLQKEPCEQKQPLRRYRNKSGGCSVCSSCVKLGLLTKQGCSDYEDEICYNICLDSDAEYDDVMGVCTKKQQPKSAVTQSPKQPVATALVTTSPRLIADLSSALIDSSAVSSQSKPTPGSFSQIEVALIAFIPIVALLICLIACMILYLCKDCKDKAEDTQCQATGSVKMHPPADIAGSDEALLPDTKEKKDNTHCLPVSMLQDPTVDPAYRPFENKNKDMPQREPDSETYECIDESQMNTTDVSEC